MGKTAIIAMTFVLGGALSACGEAENSSSIRRAPIEQTVAPGHQVTPPCQPGSPCVR